MRSRFVLPRVVLLTGAGLLISATAAALPSPKTEAELLAAADLVVDAKCTAAVCEGQPYEEGGKTITTYVSTLTPSTSYKGGQPGSIQVTGEKWEYDDHPPMGLWHQEPIPVGWVGKLYLKKQPDGTYTKVWWNAMVEDKGQSAPVTLPECAGADSGGCAVVAGAPGASALLLLLLAALVRRRAHRQGTICAIDSDIRRVAR